MLKEIKYKVSKYRNLIILLGCFLITLYIGNSYYSLVMKTNENNDYSLNELDARYTYNDISVEFLNTNFSNTNTIISPMTIQKAYYNYMIQNDIVCDSLFSLFGNGLYNFNTSSYLLDEPLIKVFTAGNSKNQYNNADISANISDKFVLDEINAKINTLSNEKVVYTVNESNVFNYNIFGLCVLDSRLCVESYIEEGNNYIIKGNYEIYKNDKLVYVKIPLENSNYSIVFKKGTDLAYNKFVPLYTETKECILKIPKINYESVEYPSKMYVNTVFGDEFSKDSNLTNITTICHLNLTCVSKEENLELLGNIEDFSKGCTFYIQNNNTGSYIILGNFI